jgi:hypothetical protein
VAHTRAFNRLDKCSLTVVMATVHSSAPCHSQKEIRTTDWPLFRACLLMMILISGFGLILFTCALIEPPLFNLTALYRPFRVF